MKKLMAVVLLAALAAGCNSYDVNPVPAGESISKVYVIENPETLIEKASVEKSITDEMTAHGITAKVVKSDYNPGYWDYVVRYDTDWAADFWPYMTEANIRIEKGGKAIANGHYYLIGDWLCMDYFTMFRSPAWKMHPLFEKLLQNVKK